VAEVRALRLRASGARLFVEATVAIPRTMPFQQAHDIMDNIEKAVAAAHPSSDVMIHAEPHEGKDESIADRIRMIILGKGLGLPHKLEIVQKDQKYHIDFDIEYRKGKGFVEAHQLASDIEQDIHDKVQDVAKVTIHMEETSSGEVEKGEETGSETGLRKAIERSITEDRRVLRCSEMTLLKVGDRYHLSVNCQFEKERTLDEIHQVICEIETKLYDDFSNLRRITIHAEPG